MSIVDVQKPEAAERPASARPEPGTGPKQVEPAMLRRDSDAASPTTTARLMIVDDEPVNIKVVQKYLKQAGYQQFLTTTDPRLVLDLIAKECPDVVLLDVMMPEINGLEILRRMRDDARSAHIPTIILTASDSEQTKLDALELGATDFLTKPVNAAELIMRARNALAVKSNYDHLKDFARELECQVRRRTAELAASRLELIHCLARAAEYRDNETGRHVVRVGRYAGIIARKMALEEPFIELIEHAAPLHDMGKVGIPDAILLKPGKLDPEEFELMQKHCGYGKRTFEPMSQDEWRMFKSHTFLGEMIMDTQSSPIIVIAAQIALTHHEKWDGSGYPLGLSGEDIPLPGRITAVADVFDALSSKRPYKPAFPMDRCFDAVREAAGTHFDPQVVDAFLTSRNAIVQVRLEHADIE
jgi:putative two-component system response regulator